MATLTEPAPNPTTKAKTLRGHWLWGCLPRMLKDPLGIYFQAQRECGDVARIRLLPGVSLYLLSHPDGVDHVLQSNHRNYRKPEFFNEPVGYAMGDGMVTAEGPRWLSKRRTAQPAFHQHSLQHISPIMVDETEHLVRDWQQMPAGSEVESLNAMMCLVLNIASRAMLGRDLGEEKETVGNAFRTAFDYAGYKMNLGRMVPDWLAPSRKRNFVQAKKVIDRVVGDAITTRRREGGEHRDLLSILIHASDEEDSSKSEQDLIDEVRTLLAAGHETMGAALAWAWYLLGKHPQIQQEVCDEIHGHLQGRSATYDDLQHLPLTKAVLQETLRLYPPAWGQPRESLGEDVIQGCPIPAKAQLVVSQYVTHRHPDFWDDPEEFKPERFMGERANERHRYAYFPFGGGPRICIGNNFAMMEGQLILATILQQFRVELVPDQNFEYDLTFTLRPKHGVKVRLWPR